MVNIEVEVEAGAAGVLAEQLGFVGLVDRGLQPLALADELAAYIDVTGIGAHREAGDQAALDEQVRIVPHDLAVFAGAGLGLVGVDDEIMRPPVRLLGHERPLQAGRKTGAAASTQARGLHLIDDAIASFGQDGLGAVPGAALARAFEPPIMEAVEIAKDAVLVGEHCQVVFALFLSAGTFFPGSSSSRVVSPPIGAENCRFTCGPGRGRLPAASASSS